MEKANLHKTGFKLFGNINEYNFDKKIFNKNTVYIKNDCFLFPINSYIEMVAYCKNMEFVKKIGYRIKNKLDLEHFYLILLEK